MPVVIANLHRARLIRFNTAENVTVLSSFVVVASLGFMSRMCAANTVTYLLPLKQKFVKWVKLADRRSLCFILSTGLRFQVVGSESKFLNSCS